MCHQPGSLWSPKGPPFLGDPDKRKRGLRKCRLWWHKEGPVIVRGRINEKNNIQEGHQLQAFLVNLVFLLDPGGDKSVRQNYCIKSPLQMPLSRSHVTSLEWKPKQCVMVVVNLKPIRSFFRLLTFSPGGPVCPWGPGIPCRNQSDMLIEFVVCCNCIRLHTAAVFTWVPGVPCWPGGPGSPWGPWGTKRK